MVFLKNPVRVEITKCPGRQKGESLENGQAGSSTR